ncbi:type II toxin-antitoxin system HigB family toxin [Chitinophaga sp. CF418]|uniref:type II toxin-antitoxin system HigB family toxin n=1 Tax=Chitinophaga sp. CF418 TaxID=1855287 RepID=UPI0009212ED0|nr:mRNA interferase HigB [Chitinophaga sp. CF418]
MRVLSRSTIIEYANEHPDSTDPLLRWYRLTCEAAWKQFQDIKDTFGSVDYVGDDLYVFNIKGNRYRLIARIFFGKSLVYIRFFGSHAEYDKLDVSTL